MNEQQILIRHATTDDISTIMELILLKAEFDGCLDSLEATPQKLEDTIFCQNPLAFILLAEIDENAIGFASYHRIYSTFLAKPGIWLDDLYIKAEYRHCGVGTALINHLCRINENMGGARIDWIVRANNLPAVKFYEKMGAKIIERVRLCRLEREAIATTANELSYQGRIE
ncbi:GCN5 family acetyltransferase [Scytonema hofmannii PCC 7110]|uniref:GCN5 family acetyltransferase n=1 Tax=Scytonema hofmannii PCC 7110 TaxID=128403 RepID=A0A139X5Q6_9CYAN|nr:GNAT family N-acetyltransferase [Scytonema hofmannii]KYC40029.1 GCN5 family acetyltransferase [Scytonema hofmannii PCC 7110]